MNQELARPKLLVLGLGISVVIYSVIVLGYVGTTPDIGLRGLLSDSDAEPSQRGMIIRQITESLESDDDELCCIGVKPRPDDLLTRIYDRQVRSFLDFSSALRGLRNARIESGGQLDKGTDPLEDSQNALPPLVEIGEDRWVEIEFVRAEYPEPFRAWLRVRSLPLSEVLLSFVWLVLQFGIFAVSALAAWHRPFDRSARLFFAMCATAMGGFIGGFHWWVISSSLILNIPFLVCALLVPATSLHFFLSYPRPLGPMERSPKPTIAVIYSLPAVAVVAMSGLFTVAWWMTAPEMSLMEIDVVRTCLQLLRDSIYGYLVFAAICFLIMLGALATEYWNAATLVELNQIKWMFRAAVISAVPISYTLYLALFDRTGFALGSARIPMFLASLSFMLAYSIGIARFKLMLVDQLVSRGMLYYAVSLGLTIGYGVCVALVAFFANKLNGAGSVPGWFQQALSLGVLLTFSVVLLTWSRDRLQQGIDRRFYREKYQLDKALQRVNRAADRLEDRHTLGQRMLNSCREVLGARLAILYLSEPAQRLYQLAAIDGEGSVPEQVDFEETLIERLKVDDAILRVSFTPGDPLRESLKRLKCEVLFPLKVDGEIEGVVVLSRREDGTPYTAEDLTFLNTLGQFTAVALRSVRVHQDFARLNEEIRIKANKIDEQKRQIVMMQSELTASPAPAAPSPPAELKREMIKGSSAAIRAVLDTVGRVAASESSVLIQGASGTGKELLAQALHENSPRSGGPQIRVHCAALAPSLLESELFGHVKGAFTGAHRDRIGRFEMANGGTLFLDEIGDISLETQIKLLRVLQTRSFEPVGGTRTVEVDVRLITATHQDLHKLIREGRFREDLYYRLNVINITLPTLAERADDIFELSLYFLKRSTQRTGKRISHLDSDALEALKRYQWPGNIRELENVIERAVVMCEGDFITVSELPPEFLQSGPTGFSRPSRAAERSTQAVAAAVIPPKLVAVPPAPREEKLVTLPRESVSSIRSRMAVREPAPDESESAMLERILRECGGNKAKAARKLGLPRSTFFSKLKKSGLA